jgi:hypothetical protein
MPEGAGLLLDQTYRMHPDLCRDTSEVFYDGKLRGAEGLGRQEILGGGRGLVRACAWWRCRIASTPFSGHGDRTVRLRPSGQKHHGSCG